MEKVDQTYQSEKLGDLFKWQIGKKKNMFL